ncbi:MAG: FAD-dependent oxidoreductase, partial [Kiritimatiellae bacterium]|nr:FAD-dependent oxidoreductase [Kiritimatiellia bacterium]
MAARIALPPLLGTFAGAANVPVVHDVDVLVVGGSGAAVEAAVAAAEQGASVFLAAPRTYLGDDSAGRLRLWLEEDEVPQTDLAKRIYGDARPVGMPFTYVYNTSPAVVSADELPADPERRMLNDGLWNNRATCSVRCYGAVQTNTLDLGSVQQVTGLTVHAFVNAPGGSYGIFGLTIHTSQDGVNWTEAGVFSRSPAINTGYESAGEFPDSRQYDFPLATESRYIRIVAKPFLAVMNVWWGEVVVKGAAPLAPQPYEMRVRATPLHVKRSLDAALIDAGVRYVTGTYATDAVVDGAGRPSGAVMVNRSGRFAVRAKCVVDATEFARIARSAGAPLRPFVPGNYAMSHVVMTGEAPQAAGLSVQPLPGSRTVSVTGVPAPAGMPSVIEATTYRCTMQVPLSDASAGSYAAAQQSLRDAVFTPTQVDTAEMPIWTPSESIVGQATSTELQPSPQTLPLATLRPSGMPHLLVLGAMADVSRAAAAGSLGSPANAMTLGRRAGLEAAADAATRGELQSLRIQPAGTAGSPAQTLREVRGRWLPSARSVFSSLAAPVEDLPVLGTCDVVVVGGGTSGSPAAIAAARAGCSVVVCEYQHALGGVQTVGLLGSYYHGNSRGFTLEIDAGVAQTGAVLAQSKAEWYRRQIRGSGGDVRFGTMACGVVMSGGSQVGGVVVVGPDGRRGIIQAKVVVDSTGNADIAAAAGAETEFITAAELSVQGATMNYRPLGKSVVNIDIGFSDDTDGFDMFFYPLRARQTWGTAQYWDQSQMVDSRERRRIIGDVYVQPLDFLNRRTFPDTIVQCKATHDTHGQASHDLLMVSTISGSETEYDANLPYRALLPVGLDGLLVTGLGISAHRDAIAVMRMQRDVQNQGYAAGHSAALAAQGNVQPRQIDVDALQQHLVATGVLDASVLGYQDNLPLPDSAFDAAVNLVPLYGGYGGVWVLMTDTNRAIPRLRSALQSATDPLARARYGTVLAMFGDPSGGADIHAVLASAQAWDAGGWNFISMPAFGRKLSHYDSYLIALGRIRYAPALPDIHRLASMLDGSSAYSHFRAVALAAEGYGEEASVSVLSSLLAKPGIRGHSLRYGKPFPVYGGYSGAAGDAERTRCLREISIARALYNLGDDAEGNGEAVMQSYLEDPRSAYATHASLVLGLDLADPGEPEEPPAPEGDQPGEGGQTDPAINHVPYLSTDTIPHKVPFGEVAEIGFYVTDYHQREYLADDDAARFSIAYWVNGVRHEFGTVPPGDHVIAISGLPKGRVLLGLQATDAEGRKSHRLFQEFLVVDPADEAIAGSEVLHPDLALFGIRSDDADPAATTAGLNTLLGWAAANGYKKVVLPPGRYRISETNTVRMPSGMTLDMNGATFKLNPNALGGSMMLDIANCTNSHVRNGTLEGDLLEHDFANAPDNSEWVNAYSISGRSAYCTVENLLVTNVTGYGTCVSTGQTGRWIDNLGPCAAGDIDANGRVVPSSVRCTYTNYIDIAEFKAQTDFLQLGIYLGYQGNPAQSWGFVAHFYDEDKVYLEAVEGYLYRRLYIPEAARYVRLTLLGSAKPTNLSLFNIRSPYNCAIRNVRHANVRCVGMVVSGSNNLLVEDCRFDNCGWAAARCAFDAEDGWDLMQDLTFRRNVFGTNPANEFLTCAGHNVIAEDNEMGVYIWDRTHSPVVRDNAIKTATYNVGSLRTSGYGRISGNVNAGRVNLSPSAPASDKAHGIRGDVCLGGISGTIDGRANFYRCAITNGSVSARVYHSSLYAVTNSGGAFALFDSAIDTSAITQSTADTTNVVVGCTVANSSFGANNAWVVVSNSVLADTTLETLAGWNSTVSLTVADNDIATSRPFLVRAHNNFARIALEGNRLHATDPGFQAVSLLNAQHASMFVEILGNEVSGSGGSLVKRIWLTEPEKRLYINLVANRLENIRLYDPNVAGYSQIVITSSGNLMVGQPDATLPGSGTATSSGSLAGHPSANAFDHVAVTNPAGMWLAAAPAEGAHPWIGYQFDSGLSAVVTAYRVWNVTGMDSSLRAPRDFRLEGSNDGVNWTLLDVRSGETGWLDAEDRLYAFANATAYSRYRFMITANNGAADATGVGELAFYVETPDPEGEGVLVIAGSPLEFGTPTPTYGSLGNLLPGTVVSCTSPTGLFEVSPGRRASCSGYALHTNPAAPTLVVSGVATHLDYTNHAGWARLTWLFADASYAMVFEADSGGTVSSPGGWYAIGDPVAVSARAEPGFAFSHWIGDVPPDQENLATLSFTADAPRTIQAVFAVAPETGGIIYVSPAGDGTTGASWATAFKTIAPGVAAAAAGDTVLVGAGTYAITAAVMLTNAISLIGVDGPSATTIQANNCRGVHVTATGAGALVAGFTVTGGNAEYNKGANIYLQGAGTVSNCVAKACQAWQWANGGGIAADAGLVTHCVVHGNRVDNRSGAGVWLGGSSVLANSLVYGNTNKVNKASYSGGGVYAQESSVVRNCAVVRNAAVLGGGVSQVGGAQILNTVVADNILYEGTTLNNLAFANGSKFSHCCVQPTNGLSGAGNTDLFANLDW